MCAIGILLAISLSGCATYDKINDFVGDFTRNPFTAVAGAVTGGKRSLPEILNLKIGYKNGYLTKLKGVNIAELRKRGIQLTAGLEKNEYILYDFMYSYGSDTITNTYAVYGDGRVEQTGSHADYKVATARMWFVTDDNGVIKDYKEFGNSVPVLPTSFRNKIADLLGEQRTQGSDTRIWLVLNKSSGNYGLAVSGAKDNDNVMLVKAFASCVHKDTGIALSQLKTPTQIIAANKNDACKMSAVEPPRALALFRNKLSNGQYEFHGAFSSTDNVPQSEYNKRYNDCKTTGTDCRVIRTFGIKDVGKVF